MKEKQESYMMNSNNPKVISIVENTIFKALQEFGTNDSLHLSSDLYIQIDPESGELQIFDDQEDLLAKVVIFDWVNSQEDESFYQTLIPLLKKVLTNATNKGLFEHSNFVRPFSVSLTDEGFTVIEELLFLDDDTFRLDDPLLKDMDKDLEDFLNRLLSDME